MSNNATTVPSYTDYFRQLTVQHRWLLHDVTSENADGDIEKKHFTRWGVDEAVTGLRSKLGWPALLLELYEIVTKASNVYDVKGFYSGAFTVLDEVIIGSTESEMDAFEKCEIIYGDILKQIWQDHYGLNKNRCVTPFAEFSFDNLNIIPVGPLFENQFGWRIEFQFKPKYLLQINQAPEEGVFITSNSES
jgi:hypothetical protein